MLKENLIQEEQMLAKTKMIEEMEFQNHTLANLTRENVARVEAMIKNDSTFLRASNVKMEPIYNKKNKLTYGGSSAYWLMKLKPFLTEQTCEYELTYEDVIKGCVESIDRENSTHLNADNCGRREIIDRLHQFDRSEMLKCLMDPYYNDMRLIQEISRITSAMSRARTNLSFASKFCHYACFYMFEGTEYQDNYSIYDGIIKNVMPWYLGYYKIKEKYDLKDYKMYMRAIDSILNAIPEKISRNGFDHLLWYYHKGRI